MSRMTIKPFGRMCFLVTSESRGKEILHLVDIEPISDDGNRVPMLLRCGCEDHIFRGGVCKHIIRVLEAIAGAMEVSGDVKTTIIKEALKKRQYTLKR